MIKRVLRLGFGLLYTAALLFALVLLYKPGASIFYSKYALDAEQISTNGAVFETRLPFDARIFAADTVLFFENGERFELAAPGYLASAGAGNYAPVSNTDRSISVLFVPGAPAEAGLTSLMYQVSIRPRIFSSDWGGRILLLLVLGLAASFWSLWRVPEKRALLLSPPRQLASQWGLLFERPMHPAADEAPASTAFARGRLFEQAALHTLWMAFLYALMEWIFFVTKPSFMDILSWGEKIKILALSGLLIALLGLLALLILGLLELILGRWLPALHRYAYPLPAAVLAACLSLILFDNFTYTVFKFGIVNAAHLTRILYALGLCAALVYFLRKFAQSSAQKLDQAPRPLARVPAAAVLSLSMVLALVSIRQPAASASLSGEPAAKSELPNIILLGTDGLNASSMSAYGYQRDTTPFISQFAQESLVSENNFTNSAHSTGSDTALLTSKLPFETRVLFPPDTLKGSDKFLHLPGMLKRSGYRTVSLGVPYYVDVDTINFQNAFDAVSCVEKKASGFSKRLSEYGFDEVLYFSGEIRERISERAAHIFFISEMQNRLAAVTGLAENGFSDRQRLDCLRADLAAAKQSGQPLFAHVHLMLTHGPKFSPEARVFSKDQQQSEPDMVDFFDDAVLSYDIEVQRLVAYLKDLGIFDNTILVLYTDHGPNAETLTRLPLIIHFPRGQHANRISANTQNLDIAPTLLDYLEIEKPQWMKGSSLLGEIDPRRLIIAGYGRNFIETSAGQFELSAEAFKPPFYQFGSLTVTQCQRAYRFDLIENSLKAEDIEGYPTPCPLEELDTQEQIRQKIGAMFSEYGFSLPGEW